MHGYAAHMQSYVQGVSWPNPTVMLQNICIIKTLSTGTWNKT